MVTEGLIFDIERFSAADGPGIRTVVFFKGCNLRCYWCHNPESIRPRPELELDPTRCIGCGQCAAVCPVGAHRFADGAHTLDRDRCRRCFRCAELCPPGALRQIGRRVSVEDCMRQIREDAAFYGDTGGVTLSGGEVLFQAQFAAALLRQCRAEGFSTAIESNLAFPWQTLEPLLPFLDLVMADIKHPDPLRHASGTGSSNAAVLENLRRLDRAGMPLIVRTPVIPGFNSSPDAICAAAQMLGRLSSLRCYELLTYNPMGNEKRRNLGYDVPEISPLPAAQMRALAQQAGRFVHPVLLDGQTVVY